MFDTSELIGRGYPHRCILSQAMEGAGYVDASERVVLSESVENQPMEIVECILEMLD